MSGQKSEKPTPKKLRDARKKGQVPRSKELVGALVTLGILLVFYLGQSFYMRQFKNTIDYLIVASMQPFELVVAEATGKVLKMSFWLMGPLFLVVVLITILASFAQGGWVFSIEVVKPKLENMSPAKTLKHIFSVKNLMELVKSIIKAFFLSLLIYLVLKSHLEDLTLIPHCGLDCVHQTWGYLALIIFTYTAIFYLVVAFLDTFFQQRQHMKSLRMSMEEIKKEYKETEGDQHIKGMRTSLYREIISESLAEDIGDSSVLVTNPTHFAVGLRYKEGETDLPLVTFRETGETARAAKRLAMDRNIPVMENIPLARKLFEKSERRKYIPTEMIEEVALVIKWLKSLPESQSDKKP